MDVCEEDANFKQSLLEEQLGRLHANLLRNANSVERHQSKDWDLNNMKIKQSNDCNENSINIKYENEMLISDETCYKLPTKMMDMESYKRNQYADNRANYNKEKNVKKQHLEKHKVQRILNEISKKESPQLFKDIWNYLKQRLDPKLHNQFGHISDKEGTDSLNNSFNEEANSISFLDSDSIKEDITHVKEAFSIENTAVVDLHCNKDSDIFGSLDIGDTELDLEAADKESKNHDTLSKTKIQQLNKFSKCSDNIILELRKNADEFSLKYAIDIIEREKMDPGNEGGDKLKPKDVTEKNDTEESEKHFQQMEFAEFQDISTSMLYSESLSKVSCAPWNTPNTSCFLSSVAGSVLMDKDSLVPIYSLDSSMPRVENRLSLEFLVPRNFCCYCNIIASRQTNMPSIDVFDDMAFSQIDTKHSLTEDIILHVEKKACNVVTFLNSFDLNVCNISLSKKYDSKNIAMMNVWGRDFINHESELSCQDIWKDSTEQCELEIQESLLIDHDSVPKADIESSFEELQDLEHINGSKGMVKEEVDDDFEEVILSVSKVYTEYNQKDKTQVICEGLRDIGKSFSQSQVVEAEVEDFCRDLYPGQKEAEETGEMNDHKNKDTHEMTEHTLGELRNQENGNGYRDILHEDRIENNVGKVKYPDKSGSQVFQEEEIQYKGDELRNPEFMQKKEQKQCIQRCENNDLERQSHSQNCPLGKVDQGWSRGEDDDLTKLDWGQDSEQNPQENCHRDNWMCGFSLKLFPNTPKRKVGNKRRGYFTKSESKKDKIFVRKSGRNKCIDTVSSKKINRNGRKKKQKQRNHTKFKLVKSANYTSFNSRIIKCYLNNVSMKKYSSQHFKNGKGNLFHLDGDPPVRLHLVKAKVCNRSGGEGSHGSSNRRYTSGAQGNGNQSSDRGAGSSRQNSNGNGSSSSGDGNQNNDNNNNNNLNKGNSSENKSSSKDKNMKPKKGVANNSEDNSPMNTFKQSPHELKRNLPETPITSPSLPKPQLDPEHIAERHNVERDRQFHGTNPVAIDPPVSAQNEELEANSGTAQNFLPNNEEASDIQHAVVSIFQLCDTIGDATHSLPTESDAFKSINVCLTRLIHDLTLAADEDNRMSCDSCDVCMILSQLLIHQANPGHDGFVRACDQCAQIFNLMMQHCIGCIQTNRPKSRLTQSDLCYKICKYLQWDAGQLNLSMNKLKGKVLKYCDKVLGSTADMVLLRYLQGDTTQAISEIGMSTLTDIPSTGLSSSTTLSLNGNIVATETGDQDQQQTYLEEVQTFVNPVASSVMTSVVTAIPPSNVSAGTISNDPPCHMRLTRKSSQRKTPAIPPPIVEENQTLDCSATESAVENTDEGKNNDIENIIYKRWGSKGDDPYETQKTYGESNQYGSLPLGYVHDVAQFYSVSTRPSGMPGIGEVVFGHPSQLRIVATFWDKKREECEKTQTCPYQHREEGVILADQKENFGILHTRYQKHHQWERVSHLGNGMSGKCHLAIDLKTDFKFCCKKIHLLRYAEEELSLWSEMHNAYIVRLYGAIRHGVKIYIFSEFIDGGSLAACIEEQKRLGRRLSHWSAINYFQQLLKVLAFLQKKNILHEDIKADNILLRRNSTYLAVTDFGTSRRLQDPKELKNKSPVGSPTHWSPEKATMEGHGFPSDLWAAVCVLVHMLSGEPPWLKRFMKKAAILNFIIYTRSPPMEDVPDSVQLVVRDLIEKGFVKDPQVRPSSSELLQHSAFSILDEGKPETYFSTLASMAHSGLHAIRMAAAAANEPRIANKEEPPPNTLNSVSAEATVLFETNINTGPYQESDSRPDNMNHQSCIGILQASNPDNQTKAASISQRDASSTQMNENQPVEVESNAVKDRRQTSGCQHENVKVASTPLSTEDGKAGQPTRMDSKVNQLVEPFDINKLLPQFDDLFASCDSLNTQPIKDFFTDSYSIRDLSDARQSSLQVYKPEERVDELPNLSIFDDICETTAQQNDGASITMQVIRNRFPVCESPSHSQLNFMLSSGSDDCTSADLFDFDPAARNSGAAHNVSNNLDTQAIKEALDSAKQSAYPPGDVSPTVSTGSNPSTSGTSNLQQRKPTNLTLNVTCTTQSSKLARSHSNIQAVSVTSTHEIEQKNRSSTWTQLSTITQASYHTGSTPISSQSASAHRATSGTSVPSTASSGNSQFSYLRTSVIEDQERMFQELTYMNPFSPTSSDSDNLGFMEYLQLESVNNNEASEYEESQDIQTLRNAMLEEIDETKLVGHNLVFYDDRDVHLFTMRIETLPTYWKHLIDMVRRKISRSRYNHFRIYHTDNTPVKFNHPLTKCQFKVVRRQDPGPECWCQQCHTMY